MFNQRNSIFILSWFLVLIWSILIFNLSAQPAYDSNNLSKGLTEHIVEKVEKVTPSKEFNIDRLNHLLRKNAHFFLYLLLTTLVMNALRQRGITGIKAIALALGLCVLYAITDEVHQLFVPGRGAQLKDIFIDSSGAVIGLGFYGLLVKLVKLK